MTDQPSPAIRVATHRELPAIQAIYAHARQMQIASGQESWPAFPAATVLEEMDRSQLLCVVDRDRIAGVFSIAYEDGALWGERERGEHVYLHRIAKAADCAVSGLLNVVLAWTHAHCQALGRSGLRMDTWASNTALIALYEGRGFRVVERIHVGHDERLPAQYYDNDFVLLEETEPR